MALMHVFGRHKKDILAVIFLIVSLGMAVGFSWAVYDLGKPCYFYLKGGCAESRT